MKIYAFALLICLLPFLNACRAPQVPLDDPNIRIQLIPDPDPPIVGASSLTIFVTDADEIPIEDASLEVRGDMTHAGMVPVLRSVNTSLNGRYEVPFEWTMTGDWFVDVIATLPDGTQSRSRFHYRLNE